MTKVSKNIRKIRTAKNLTQDDLARQLFVTRQTVSGWENGRTQPDIETLCKISEIFSVPVEDLIYGEKRFNTAEEKAQSSKRTLIIIFSIIASVLMGTGLILIFVTYWTNFPVPLQTVFSFVPMLAGQAAAVYTFIKHRDSVAWREGASVLWCAGMAATVALIDSIFLLPTDFAECLLIDALLFLPMVYILDAVTPMIVYFGSTLFYTVCAFDYGSPALIIILSIVFFTAGFVYVLINRKKKDDVRHIFTLWLSVMVGFGFVLINTFAFDFNEPVIFSVITTFFLCLYAADKSDSWALPYKPLGLFGTIVISLVSVFLLNPDVIYTPYNGYNLSERIGFAAAAFVCLITVAVTGIINRKTFMKNIMKTVYCSSTSVLLLAQLTCCVFFPEENHIIVYTIIQLSALVMSISLIAEGVIASKFTTLNAGLIATSILIGYIIYSLVEISMLGAGILLVIFSSVLFAVNYLLARKIKIKKKEENQDA